MTKSQMIALRADWWPAACRAQGWKISDDFLRLRVLSVAVSYPPRSFPTILDALAAINSGQPVARNLESSKELDSRADVDRVKALLLFLAGDLKAAQEMDHAEEGDARRSRHVIVEERLRCLALYPLEKPMGMAGAQALLAELLKDMFNKGRRFEKITVDDLSEAPQFYRRKGSSDLHEGPSQLKRLLMRLDGLLHTNKKPNGPQGYRVKAGHSLHDMRLAAGLRCDCRYCCLARRQSSAPPEVVLPPLPAPDTDDQAESVDMLTGQNPF
jgi:hypothetical protein